MSHKRKASCIALPALQVEPVNIANFPSQRSPADPTQSPVESSSGRVTSPWTTPGTGSQYYSSKRQRLSSTVSPLIAHELQGCIHVCPDLLESYVGNGQERYTILERLLRLNFPGLTCHNQDLEKPTHSRYILTPPSHSDATFPAWFCQFANACSLDSSSTRSTWALSQRTGPIGLQSGNQRPDFVLSLGTACTDNSAGNPGGIRASWRSVLAVGEHQSAGRSAEALQTRVAWYAEQVFIAHPFRRALWTIVTSNSQPIAWFYRFDRAGAFYVKLNYSSTDYQLLDLIGFLYSLSHTMDPQDLGFHVDSIRWNTSLSQYPLDAASAISFSLHLDNNNNVHKDGAHETIILEKLIFVAGGIVGRGTRVWEGTMTTTTPTATTSRPVVVKYSWQATARSPEESLYKRALMLGVVGLGKFIAYQSFENIQNHVRFDQSPINPLKPEPPIVVAVPLPLPAVVSDSQYPGSQYLQHMHSHNRALTRLVLGEPGHSLAHPLSPLSTARALLAALIGHGSLFFDAQILHRDVSPYNIISLENPIVVDFKMPLLSPDPDKPAGAVCVQGTKLYGYIIDLDYAIHIEPDYYRKPSGAIDKTGIDMTWKVCLTFSWQSAPIQERSLHVQCQVLLLHERPLATRTGGGGQRSGSGEPRPISWSASFGAVAGEHINPGESTKNHNPNRTSNSFFSKSQQSFSKAPTHDPFPTSNPLLPWFTRSSEEVAAHKLAYIVDDGDAFEKLLDCFRDGFNTEAWKHAARELRYTLWAMDALGGAGNCRNLREQLQSPVLREEHAEGRDNSRQENEKPQSAGTNPEFKPRFSRTQPRQKPARTIKPNEVRLGVVDFEGYLEFKSILEDLVQWLEMSV